jgi:hypothetical protein
MKKIQVIFTIILVFFCCNIFANGMAGITAKKDSVFIWGSVNQSLITVENEIYNTPSAAVEYKWEIVQNTFPSNWDLGICFGGSCYALPMTIYPNFTMSAGETVKITFDISPNGNVGTGVFKVRIYPKTGVPSDGIILTFYADLTVGVKKSSAPEFSMYPNPVVDNLSINFDHKGKHHVEIYSILGKKVLTKEVEDVDFMKVSFAGYQQGRYIVMYRSEDGRVITRTISKE